MSIRCLRGAAIIAAAAVVVVSCSGEGQRDPAARNTVMPMRLLPTADGSAIDRGIGLVSFREDWSTGPETDTLSLWAAPHGGAPVARFVWQLDAHGVWSYRVEQVDGGPATTASILEFDYETSGLAIDSVDTAANAVRVLFGSDARQSPATAWARLDDRLTVTLWRDHLPRQALFFLDSGTAVLYDAPDGQPVHFPLPDDDYQLIPDSVAGAWMRVHASTPHFCSGDPAEREITAWVRFLSDDGRPAVWYYTRGC